MDFNVVIPRISIGSASIQSAFGDATAVFVTLDTIAVIGIDVAGAGAARTSACTTIVDLDPMAM